MECKAFIPSSYAFTILTHTFGRFRWVDCQLKYLARCLPVDLEHALNELLATLDETYECTLGEIKDANWEAAQRLLQCVAVASRPLWVEELGEILAFNFNAGPIPKFHVDCRLKDPVKAVLSICSTLLSIVDVENSQVVQFGHFLVKEFLTSTHFAQKCNAISSHYHISMSPAHSAVAQACLGILLHLPENVTKDSLVQYPLAEYASEHWFEHARFEGVLQSVIEGMKQLFDGTKLHFSIWLWIYDPTLPTWKRPWTRQAEKPFPPTGTPLHYTTFCGLCEVVEVLAIGPQDLDSWYFNDELTPLHLASQEGHLDIGSFLVKHGTNVAAQNQHGLTLLHQASRGGHLDLAQFLVEHGANAADQDQDGSTPLHQASQRGHLDLAQFLIKQGANAAAQDQCGSTPLHQASEWGHLDLAQFLIEHGANMADKDQRGLTPLHRASLWGHLDLAQLLVEHSANAVAQDQDGLTPLHQASLGGHLNLALFLVEHGANAADQDQDGSTPLHQASQRGHLDLAQFLIEHGANVADQDQDGSTPLYQAQQEMSRHYVTSFDVMQLTKSLIR